MHSSHGLWGGPKCSGSIHVIRISNWTSGSNPAPRELGDEQWYAYVPYDEGPVFDSTVSGMVEDLADKHGVLEFFESVKPPDEGDELGIARDFMPPGAGLILRIDLTEVNDELIEYLAQHPEKMHDMAPRKFEELVAAIFRAKGYTVELTPATRDGGFDMRAFHRNDVGIFLTLIECKRYLPERRVSVEVVRGLYGVTVNEKATTGLIVTTSSFTRDAKSFQDQNKYRVQLADQADLQVWLRDHKRK
jgi:restriction system protein